MRGSRWPSPRPDSNWISLSDRYNSYRRNLLRLRTQLGTSTPIPEKTATTPEPQVERSPDLQERVETLEAQVKLHDETKLESSSKYPIRISGLLLFNSFINRGTVDNIDLPSIATSPTIGSSSGSAGAGLRQTILGIEGFGPRIAGARTSADISVDFFGGIPYSNFGTASGLVRLRTASINFDWTRDSLQVGMEGPLISPLSPTSYATVAEPGMAWAGNLWPWAPQVRFAHRFSGSDRGHWKLEAGFWHPPPPDITPQMSSFVLQVQVSKRSSRPTKDVSPTLLREKSGTCRLE